MKNSRLRTRYSPGHPGRHSMPVYRIPRDHLFPDPRAADASGLLGVGGDLSPERVWLAYRMGIFPWFSSDQPVLWWSPDPRFVLRPESLRIGRSLGKRIRQGRYRVTMDRAFGEVMRNCGAVFRPGQDSTWITPDMLQSYMQLHRAGVAHSIETWEGDELVGGLYGIAVGGVFAGESMFALAPDASKVAFVHFVQQWATWGGTLVDCQVHTEHLERFGAIEVPRSDFLDELSAVRDLDTRPSPWRFDADFVCDGRRLPTSVYDGRP